MFNKKPEDRPGIDPAIDALLEELKDHESTSDEYSTIVFQIERLHKLKAPKREKGLDPNQMIAVAGNLAGIITILIFESENVITTKALSFIIKSKV